MMLKTLSQFTALISFFILAGLSSVYAEPLEVGQPAPLLSVTLEDGSTVALEKWYQESPVLIYFYPKADTPGCTKQACSLRDSFQKLSDKNIRVVGVSTDSVEDQKAFKDKFNLPFSLVADTEKKLVDAFGVPSRGAFASRQAFLIQEGKIVWRDLNASTSQQAADVLEVVKAWP